MAIITMGASGEAAEDIGVSYDEVRLGSLHEKIIGWDADESMIWDRDPEVARQFLRAVDEVQKIIEHLGEGQQELLRYAKSVLHMGLSRLQDEFVHVLIRNRQPIASDRMLEDVSFRSTASDDSLNYYSSRSFDEESIRGKLRCESGTGSEEFVTVDLVHPDAILDLKSIARTMFRSKYDRECCQAYTSVRKDALDERLSALRMERLSIEEVLEMDWRDLNSTIKRWCRALRVFVRVYLASEKRLCELVFGDLSGTTTTDYLFHDSSERSILQLLSFGEAVAIGSPRPEKLFRVLDMHEVLSDLVTDIESLFPEGAGSSVAAECDHVLFRLSECVRGTFTEFKIAIQSSASATPFSGGGVHPLTKYVMNYITALVDYTQTLNSLLGSKDEKDRHVPTPLARHLHSVASILEKNLDDRAMLYKDGAIQNLFKMNNICYMVQKVKDSEELRAVVGDDWIRTYGGKFRRCATSYERASWSTMLSFLKDEGVCVRGGSNAPSRAILKERFKGFNAAFEEVYRTQTGWIVPKLELREDLRISISVKLLQAYRTFVGRYASHLDGPRRRDGYVKYCPEDLEGYLMDLFEGVPKAMMHPRRR
ncbi:exocyst complex component EXO70B1-like [Iris pallida]|uniref:Exocyst subunit Exo70 family protein n=1 Tax=Iris pallida TaxID=29817 RepID=A0AAX6HFD3_IRIPA|nr:exocyst complex component EXO70B1-like [Iris pallida]